jgi:o-succinylbenzoate synthase
VKISYARYSRPLKAPFRYGEKSLMAREGLVLRLDSPGGVLYSEASPLPGSSREELGQIEKLLEIASALALYEAVLDGAPVAGDLPPALRFALEGFASQGSPTLSKVESNALVPWAGAEKTLADIQAKKAAGFRTMKLKLFDESIEEQLELMAAAPGVHFRLDGNRALSEEAVTRLFAGLEKIGPARVEYIEEPLSHWRNPLLIRSPVALAADECAADPRFWKAILPSPASVFVLKPTVAGGLFSLAEKAKTLEEAGKKVVYTSTFEAEPGRRALISFLLSLKSKNMAGVSTGFLFSESFLADQPVWEKKPALSPAESDWLENLPWREGP